jgi:multisubunit Na+/H+ antiporter MnhB subunit
MHIRFSPLLATGARTMIPTLVIFSVYVLVVGHDAPGGGFAGGLLGAAALLLVYLAFGDRGVRRALPTEPEIIAGTGLAIAIAAGALGLVVDDALLAGLKASTTLPLIGEVKVTSVLVFDIGVYFVVLGLVAAAIVRLGGEDRT